MKNDKIFLLVLGALLMNFKIHGTEENEKEERAKPLQRTMAKSQQEAQYEETDSLLPLDKLKVFSEKKGLILKRLYQIVRDFNHPKQFEATIKLWEGCDFGRTCEDYREATVFAFRHFISSEDPTKQYESARRLLQLCKLGYGSETDQELGLEVLDSIANNSNDLRRYEAAFYLLKNGLEDDKNKARSILYQTGATKALHQQHAVIMNRLCESKDPDDRHFGLELREHFSKNMCFSLEIGAADDKEKKKDEKGFVRRYLSKWF